MLPVHGRLRIQIVVCGGFFKWSVLQSIVENDAEQKSSRRPAVIFAVLALWFTLKWLLEFGTAHRRSWVELGVFVPLIFMLKWLQFNLTSPVCPKMAAVFSGVCLLLLLLTYVFSSEMKR